MHIIGRGRYARETYPESPAVGHGALAAKIFAGGGQVIPNGSFLTTVDFPTKAFDTAGFTITPNKLTVPAGKGGLYYVYSQVTLAVASITPAEIFSVVLEIIDDATSNALVTLVQTISRTPTGGTQGYETGAVLNLTDGQVLRVDFAQGTDVSGQVNGGEPSSFFGLFKI